MKHFILDALNIIYKHPQLAAILKHSYEQAANGLLSYITQFARKYPTYKFTAVFDGGGLSFSTHTINIFVLSSGNKTADTEIKRLVSYEMTPALTAVVSSDTEVYNYAKINGCTAITSEDFLKMINSSSDFTSKEEGEQKPRSSMISKSDLNEMMDLFTGTKPSNEGLPVGSIFMDNPLTDKDIDNMPIKGKILKKTNESSQKNKNLAKEKYFTEILKDFSELTKYSDNPKKIKKAKPQKTDSEKPDEPSARDIRDMLSKFKK